LEREKKSKWKRDVTKQTKTIITNNTSKVYSVSNESFAEIINNSIGWVDICKKLGYRRPGSSIKELLKRRCEELGLTLNLNKIISNQQLTKGELIKIRKNYQSYRSCIRKKAELVFKNSGKECKCEVCGYDKHIEIAHKKAVSEFDDSATITEINNINNLIALCPNCHWEFDNGLLKL
jgi:predicted HNH restriction endonuclease